MSSRPSRAFPNAIGAMMDRRANAAGYVVDATAGVAREIARSADVLLTSR